MINQETRIGELLALMESRAIEIRSVNRYPRGWLVEIQRNREYRVSSIQPSLVDAINAVLQDSSPVASQSSPPVTPSKSITDNPTNTSITSRDICHKRVESGPHIHSLCNATSSPHANYAAHEDQVTCKRCLNRMSR